jgi:hypothetical protein
MAKQTVISMLVMLSLAGCVSTMPPPHINSLYTGPGTPSPRTDSTAVEVFLDTAPPQHAYAVIGRVEITTENDARTLENMLVYAKDEARRLGGDALINLKNTETTTASSGGYSYPVKNWVTGEVMGVRKVENGPTNRRVLLADVVVWR